METRRRSSSRHPLNWEGFSSFPLQRPIVGSDPMRPFSRGGHRGRRRAEGWARDVKAGRGCSSRRPEIVSEGCRCNSHGPQCQPAAVCKLLAAASAAIIFIAHRGFRCHAKILLLFLGIAFFRLSSSSSPYHEHTGLYFLAVLCIPHVFLDSWHLVKALYNLRRGETLPPARRLDGLN